MIKKLGFALVMLFIMQGIACAGVVSVFVASGASGTALLTGTSLTGNLGYKTSAVPITITANPNYTLNYITKNGVTVASNLITGGGPWQYTIPLSSSTQTIYVYFKSSAPANPPVLIASAPAAVSTAVNTPLIISGATSTILYLQPSTKAKYKWSSTRAPSVVTFSPISSSVTSPAYISTSVTAKTFGSYTATLTLTAPGATPSSTKVAVTVQPPGVASSNYCLSCHNGWLQATDYIASPHSLSIIHEGPSCQSCHNPGLNLKPPVPLNHPGYSTKDTTANPGLYYSCVTCHYPGSTKVTSWPPAGFSFHSAYTGTNRCVQCHDPHTTVFNGNLPYPHFANSTTSAQFINPNVACANCHSAVDAQGTPSFNVYSANYQWAQSGKGNPKSPAYVTYQFKSMGTPAPAKPATSTANDCVRCHTTTGYINYVSSDLTNIAPFGPALGSREMVACSACHYSPFNSDVDPTTGTSFNRRLVGVSTDSGNTYHVTGYYGYSSVQTGKAILPKLYDDKGDSNICITCHTGKAAGSNIKTVAVKVGTNGAFWQNVQFISPHYMGSAGILFQVTARTAGFQIGYEYRLFSTYAPLTSFVHPSIGDGIIGPCVACHMDGSVRKHLFSPVSSSQGVIKAITSTTCAACHTSPPFDASFLQSKKEGYQASMTVVAALLADKGIYFNPVVYPYFFTTSDPLQQNFGTITLDWTRTINSVKFGSDVMGAAFNLKLLQTDAGSWAHNDAYTKRLLYDTIDFLDDGNPNNNTVQSTINAMSIDQATKNRALAYITPRPL